MHALSGIKPGVRGKKIVFFLVLFLTMAPLVLFPIISRNYHKIHSLPKIENGVLDLSGYDFTTQDSAIPLDGQWEFFWNRWIITDKEIDPKPDLMVSVPGAWQSYSIRGKALPNEGYASYRLLLENCPEDVDLTSYVPNLGIAYRVFIDGVPVSGSGIMSKEFHEANISMKLMRERLNLVHKKNVELVIELSGCEVFSGLYMAPVLAENLSDIRKSELRTFVAAVFLGIFIVGIGGYACILLFRDATIHSVTLFVLDILIFLRILMKDDFFGILKSFVPFFRYYGTSIFMRTTTIFLPIIFLICVEELVHIHISKDALKRLFWLALFYFIPLSLYLYDGHLKLEYYLYLPSLIPYIFVQSKLYQSIKKKVPYALMISVILMFMLSSLFVASMYSTGILIMNVSMYPPTCFAIALLGQCYMYMNENHEMQKEAIEAANLRLQLQESEVSLMLSQIKPHFLYNALIAIQVLCTKEPETAETAIVHFAKYLRMNMSSINSKEPIPFSQELEHIQNYVNIEKLRFKDRLSVKYNIETEEFSVPPLTIEPLVENAIKHGVCKKVTGGVVILKTYETENSYCIEVLDDGVGFDTKILEADNTKSYGFKNILFRLNHLMHADIKITSVLEQGTKVLVTIPK